MKTEWNVSVFGLVFPLKTIENGDLKTETYENASFSRETPKTESFENAKTKIYPSSILGFKTSAKKGNENERKRSNGNTPFFVPGTLGENGVMETV